MDYIYGKLNNKVKSVEYNGINSDTTNITVDNSDREHRTIKVDVIKTPGTLTINNTNGESVSFNGSVDENLTIDSPTTEQYQELVTKVNDLENNKLDKVSNAATSNRIYAIAPNGLQYTPKLTKSVVNGEVTVPIRDENGNFQVGTPKVDGDATNKEYVDNLLSTKVDKGQPGSKWQLYGIGSKTTPLPNGNTISTAEQALPNTVINRNGEGRAEVAAPVNNLEIANKQYVDTKVSKSGDTITGNLTIQGNLSVSGTTTTVDTETLKVKDNVIVTNSDKNQLIDLSGLAINTDATNTFGIMYNPTSNTVDLGLGTITTEGKFTFNENEGLPLAIRDSNSSFTQDHLISWSTDKNKLTDSGIDKSKVAQTDKTNVFVESQVFAKELQFGDSYKPSTNPLEANPTITFTKDNEVLANGTVVFQVGPIRSAYLEVNEPGQTIATTSNLKTINKTSLIEKGGNISIPVVDCNDSGFEHNYNHEYLSSVLVKKDTGTPIVYILPEHRLICRYHTTFSMELQSESLILRAQEANTTSHLTKLMDVDMGYNWQYDMDSVNLSELFEKDCGKIEILNPTSHTQYLLGTSSSELKIMLTNRLKVWGRKKSMGSGDTNISEVWDIYIEISGDGDITNTKGTIDVEELTF